MLPHVDGFLPVHNLDSLERLLEVLQRSVASTTQPRMMV
jgi:uncharacterized protein with von Willebrand factor type A (vWA) domain